MCLRLDRVSAIVQVIHATLSGALRAPGRSCLLGRWPIDGVRRGCQNCTIGAGGQSRRLVNLGVPGAESIHANSVLLVALAICDDIGAFSLHYSVVSMIDSIIGQEQSGRCAGIGMGTRGQLTSYSVSGAATRRRSGGSFITLSIIALLCCVAR
jgi:hypothetical protein